MQYIVLTGKENCGKSETMNLVYHLLLLRGFERDDSFKFRSLGNPDQKDFIDVLIKGSIRIGISTMGDYEDNKIKEDNVLDLLAQLNSCNTIIFVCNDTLKKTQAEIRQFNDIAIVQKSYSTDQSMHRIANNTDAQRILHQSTFGII